MKHFLHIGIGNLYNVVDFILAKKDHQYDILGDLRFDDNVKIWACDCKYYSKEDLALIYQSDWIDNFIYKDICDDWPETPLFDLWDCTSVMEHVNKEHAELFVKKLREKVTNNSLGYVHIDLSDHSKPNPSMKLFEDSNFASQYPTEEDKGYWLYCNRINGIQWKKYFSEHFLFDVINDEETYITFDNVRPINEE